MNRLEKAEAFASRGIGLAQMKRAQREAQMIKAGARGCSRCGGEGTKAFGTPWDLQALCGTCYRSAELDGQAKRQKAQRERMRHR
jgi:hypothetical protein